MSQQIVLIPIDQLQPNPFQPRDKIKKEDLEDLTQSITVHGVLEPLVVAHTPAGYQIIAGERRWRASKEAGLDTVPALIKKTSPKGMLEMAIIENVQRSDLSPIERAQAFARLASDFQLSMKEIGERVGKSISYVSNTMRLLDLPDAIKDGLMGGLITEGHARAIGGIMNEQLMVECYKVILKENASVRRAEDLARRFKEQHKLKYIKRGRPHHVDDNVLKQWEHHMDQVFHAKSRLNLVRSKSQTKVSITLKGNLQETQDDLEKIIEMVTEGKGEKA